MAAPDPNKVMIEDTKNRPPLLMAYVSVNSTPNIPFECVMYEKKRNSNAPNPKAATTIPTKPMAIAKNIRVQSSVGLLTKMF